MRYRSRRDRTDVRADFAFSISSLPQPASLQASLKFTRAPANDLISKLQSGRYDRFLVILEQWMSSGTLVEKDSNVTEALSGLQSLVDTGVLKHLDVDIKVVKSPLESASEIRSYSDATFQKILSGIEEDSLVKSSAVWDMDGRKDWLLENQKSEEQKIDSAIFSPL